MSQLSRRFSCGLLVVAASLALLASPLLAKGTLDIIEKFQQADTELDVATYTEPDKQPSRIGLLGLKLGTVRNSFAYNLDEWQTLIDLTAKAAKAQSGGGNWTVIGAMTEKGTTDVSHLVIAAGPGIRFALNSPAGASLTYVLASGDIPRFEQALGRVKAFVAAQ